MNHGLLIVHKTVNKNSKSNRNQNNIIFVWFGSKQYYINNKDRLLEKSKQYYHNNKEVRQQYNNEYWALNGHKYIEQRSKNNEHKKKQREYNEKYKEINKSIHKDNNNITQKDLIVEFKFSFYR